MGDGLDILQRIMFFVIPLWISVTVHEWAHAISAFWLGDNTANAQGRLTLNPIAHIDPVGTLLLPLLGVPFGWAKPVPVMPVNFTRRFSMRMGMMLTALAGPLSNVAQAILAMGILVAGLYLVPQWRTSGAMAPIFLYRFIQINVVLAVFNMFPIPPLDGSRVADYFMPQRLRPQWERIYRAGPFALIAVLVVVHLFNIPVFAWAIRPAMLLVNSILF